MKRMYRPLLDYLEEQTGAHFEMVVFPTYDDFIKEVESGYVDFAASSGAAFLRLRAENAPIRYLVTSLRQQGATQGDFYTGYIVVRKDSGITDFSQLRGKKFAFTEPDSSSGYKMPVAYMARQGLDPKTYFKKYFLVGDHNEVMKAIKNRAVDGGATWQVSYDDNVKKYGDIFRVIFKSPPIPNDAWIVGNKVPKQLSDKMMEAMIGINSITATKKGQYVLDTSLEVTEVGFSKRSPEFYSQVKDYLLSQ